MREVERDEILGIRHPGGSLVELINPDTANSSQSPDDCSEL